MVTQGAAAAHYSGLSFVVAGVICLSRPMGKGLLRTHDARSWAELSPPRRIRLLRNRANLTRA